MPSILRSRVNPPRPILKSNNKLPRNFLKKPTSLTAFDDDDEPIFSATKKDFESVQESIFSPSKKTACLSPAPLSAHVHFPATPAMAATFATHSPNTYDRTPIRVAPNSCELPPRGDRVYEPLENIFSPNKAKFAFRKAKYPSDITFQESIASILESSESSDESDGCVYTKPKSSSMSVKFALHAPPSPIPRAQSKQEIEKALTFLPYPLSPYPRSSDKEEGDNAKKVVSAEKSEMRREVKRANSLVVPSPEGRTVTPGRPAQSKRVLRRPAELNLSEAPLMLPPGLGQVLSSVPESPAVSADISLDVPSSVTGSGGNSEGSSELSAAFWLSVSVEEAPEEEGLVSPMLFGRKDGSLWSPGLPRKSRASSDMMPSRFLFSPAAGTFDDASNFASITSPAPNDPIAKFTSFTAALNVEKHFASMTSPAPNDPMATFSSFSAALTYLGSDPVIAFPPSVVLRGERPYAR